MGATKPLDKPAMTQPLFANAPSIWPVDAPRALLIGRIWLPGTGPVLVRVQPDGVYDLSALALTCSDLLDLPNAAQRVRALAAPRLADMASVLAATHPDHANDHALRLLAPLDLQAIKAAGVTFVASMLERVIEERARGDATQAEAARRAVVTVIGVAGPRHVVPLFRSGHWARRRNFHQGPLLERGGLGWRGGHPPPK
jgi:fumarylacetoacetate (FAA) hydrolase family protein